MLRKNGANVVSFGYREDASWLFIFQEQETVSI